MRSSVTIRARKTKKGFTLYFDIYDKGNRRSQTIPDILLKAASAKEAVRKAPNNVKLIRNDLENKLHNKSLSKDNSDFVPFFKEFAEKKKYTLAYKKLRKFNESIKFKDITTEWGERFKEFLYTQVKSKYTAYAYFSNVKSGLYSAAREGYINGNPLRYVKIKKHMPETEYINQDEIERLRSVVITGRTDKVKFKRREVLRGFLFAFETGLRMSDVFRLGPEHIKNGRLTIVAQKNKRKVQQKLTPEALEILKDGFFELPRRKQTGELDGAKTDYFLNELFDAVGIKKKGAFHLARHGFGTRLGEAGANMRIIQSLMGLSTVTQAARYVKDTEKARDAAMGLIS